MKRRGKYAPKIRGQKQKGFKKMMLYQEVPIEDDTVPERLFKFS